jgi:hypothetical protein
VQDEPRRFVAGVRRSVAVGEPRGFEPPHDVAQ